MTDLSRANELYNHSQSQISGMSKRITVLQKTNSDNINAHRKLRNAQLKIEKLELHLDDAKRSIDALSAWKSKMLRKQRNAKSS